MCSFKRLSFSDGVVHNMTIRYHDVNNDRAKKSKNATAARTGSDGWRA
jgi:hypothetical protein